ncbi:MAG TPA: tetratricopeptide repeat protein [Candidatus Omnitrophota bacterium]|nr:tetratricopeptide repeat protein [Candidatus Omnitrophota bacterium]HPD85150.1 tetratricopeptide repeat protein [Candidatus Omnitrophota bacterium]HRZ04349.1 tetratricopeptide repeat protein [Candidatus Omnitrophota bacterium]
MKMKKIAAVIILVFFSVFCSVSFAQTVKELYGQGMKFFEQGDYQKAIELLEKVVQMDPNFAAGYNSLGLAYKESNANPAELIWYFKAAVDIDPKFAEAYDNLGKAYYGMGNFDKAEEYCKKALEINPLWGSAEFSLGWIYLLGKPNPPEAIYYFQKVLEKKKIPYALFGLGIAYFMNNENAMTLDVITQLRELREENLAEQLENMVRKSYYVAGEDNGPLVEIKPPADQPPPPLYNQPQPSFGAMGLPPSATSGSGSGSPGKVRLKGKLHNMSSPQTSSGAEQSLPVIEIKPTPLPPARVHTSR